MLFSKDYDVKYYEKNVNGNLKESSLLNFLQDIATLSAESLGFGPSFVFENNYAWVVLKYHIEIYEELKNLSSIKLKTLPRGVSKLYAFRDFEIYNSDEKCIGKAISTWALIDMETRRLLPMQKVLDFMMPFEKKDTDLAYEKIEHCESYEYKKTFDICFDDIDVNKHANNSNYVVWALASLPDDFRKHHYPVIIDINYRKEISFGGCVLSCAKIQQTSFGEETVHFINDADTGEELMSLKITWKMANIAKY